MVKTKKLPTFEKEYRKTKGSYWTLKPNKRLIEFEKLLKRKSKVLDLGCGTGRIALYLAKMGHEVTAVDIAETGIKKLNEYAKDAGLKIKTSVADISDYKIGEKYDVIISTYAIHFLPKTKARKLFKQIQTQTKKDGLNFIGVFRKGEGNKNKYQFRNGELSGLYANWKIIKYLEYSNREKHDTNGKWHTHEMAILIAQKE